MAVLTAAVLGAILILVALVLDLGGARRDRDADQLAADAMALAAASDLGRGSLSAVDACTAAWEQLTVNLPTAVTAPAPACSTFAAMCAPTTARSLDISLPPYTITFSHPVPAGSPLLEDRTSPSLDGSPCQRFGVRVVQQRANLLASGTVRLDVQAVGRFLPGVGDVQAPLVLLSPHACEALSVSGSGVLKVSTSTGAPGSIAVDSDGSECASAKKVIFRLDGNATIEAGAVAMWALAGSRPDGAYSPGVTNPVPTASSAPVSRSAVDWRYNCDPAAGCPGAGPAHLDALTAAWSGVSPAPTVPAGFTSWTASGRSCSPSGATVVPAGDWYIDCANGLSTTGSITFQGGDIVSQKAIVASGGLRVNCWDSNTTDQVAPAVCPADPPEPSILYLRTGTLARHGGMELRETFVYLGTGGLDLTGTATLTWTAPNDPTFPFDDLLVWTESTTAIEMHGNTDMTLEGVLFAPNAKLLLRGTTSLTGIGTQIFSESLDLGGTGALKLAPKQDRIVQVGRGRPLLIR